MQPCLVFLSLLFLVQGTLAIWNQSNTSKPLRSYERKPSFWTKTGSSLKTSYFQPFQPSDGLTHLLRKHSLTKETNFSTAPKLLRKESSRHFNKMKMEPKNMTFLQTEKPEGNNSEAIENRTRKNNSILKLKELLAKQLFNETAEYDAKNKNPFKRSYPVEESQHHFLDDKHQVYQTSGITNTFLESEPSCFYHHFVPSSTLPSNFKYTLPQKKDITILGKIAVIAVLKLILGKLKAIGFLKLLLVLLLKIPFLILKFLFILKTIKFLKLISIPFFIATFAVPFFPLIALLAPLLLFPILLLPLLLPLILPFLFFLPIVPITTPVTANSRTKRQTLTGITFISSNWTYLDDFWKKYHINNANIQARNFTSTDKPFILHEKKLETTGTATNTLNQFFQNKKISKSINLIELIQKITDSQQCLERIACEIATQNDAKKYHTAVIWALNKIITIAPKEAKIKIKKYSRAYETASKKKFQNCQQSFLCQKPKMFIIHGKSMHKVF